MRDSEEFYIKSFFLKNINYIYSMLIVIIIFFIDRISKNMIINYQEENDNVVYINDFINLDLVWNTGIGFGLLSSNSDLIYNLLSLLIFLIIIFLIYLVFKANSIDKTLFSIVIGGAIGNFYDRIVYFAVPDFIDIHYQNIHWFTFNIADIFISIGIIFLILKDFFLKNEKINKIN